MTNYKSVDLKGCNDKWNVMIDWIGVVSHHLQSYFGVIELIVLCAFVCGVGYFHVQIRETLQYK